MRADDFVKVWNASAENMRVHEAELWNAVETLIASAQKVGNESGWLYVRVGVKEFERLEKLTGK